MSFRLGRRGDGYKAAYSGRNSAIAGHVEPGAQFLAAGQRKARMSPAVAVQQPVYPAGL